jgi:hypothetical protein
MCVVSGSVPSVRRISAVASTALPGAWPWALISARFGGSCSANSRLTVNRALMKPTPTFAIALKWVGSMTSIDSTPGPQDPTSLGSTRNAQTRSRGARISTEPSNLTSWHPQR